MRAAPPAAAAEPSLLVELVKAGKDRQACLEDLRVGPSQNVPCRRL
jgi:hypothetical protein